MSAKSISSNKLHIMGVHYPCIILGTIRINKNEVLSMGFPEIGSIAPDFESQTDAGETIKLSDYKGKKVVLYFYPKADTPGCTKQACNFRDNYGAFEERDVIVLGVSYDTVQEQKVFKEKFNLPFTLIADPEHQISGLYSVWDEHEITTKSGKVRTFTGIFRSTLVIDSEGKVIDSRWGVDPTSDTQVVLDILDNAGD